MQYWQWQVAAAAEHETQVSEALAAIGFHAFAWSGDVHGAGAIQLWTEGPHLPEPVLAVLRDAGLQAQADGARSEAELVDAHLGECPFALASGVWVLPGSDNDGVPEDAIRLHLPPTAAFGDGRHPTTAMAAELLMRAPCAGQRVLDLGCGTAILALIALARGAVQADCTDADADAVRVAGELLSRHGWSNARVWQSDLLDQVNGRYDIIVANIYAELLVELLAAPHLPAVLPAGHLLLSGIAKDKSPEVRQALAQAGFNITEEREHGWWCAMLTQRIAAR